uniref:Immunoglobulin domain-containing protein n=1 Tax=Cyprinus carpio TaxID=7962 RepID=A0A8C2BWZ7_CYPCA
MLRPSQTPNISEQRQRNTFMDQNLHLFLGKAVNMKLLSVLLSSLWCFLDHGVSGVMDEVSLSVNEGESVILHTGVKTDQQEKIRWYFSDIRIAEISGDLSYICTDVQCKNSDERFRNRLKLDHQTGSLTIMNTRTTDAGVYKLKIMKNRKDSNKIFIVFVHGFFSVDTHEESAFVMEGDSVSLHTNVKTNQQEKIRWYFNDVRIAQITGDQSNICTDVQCNEGTERFRDRLKLDNETGSLTIMNIRELDSGLYRLRIISSSSMNENVFIVAVYGVSAAERDKMKKKSVDKESVTLDPAVIKKQNDSMKWYFNDTLIAEITGDQSKICTDVQCKERFRDRLTLDHQTGSLTITDTRTTDSGDYKLENNRSRISIIKIFSVIVTAVPDSVAAAVVVVVVVVVVLLVAIAAVIYYRHRKSTQERQNDTMDHSHDQGNGVDSVPLSEWHSINH